MSALCALKEFPRNKHKMKEEVQIADSTRLMHDSPFFETLLSVGVFLLKLRLMGQKVSSVLV